MPARIIDVHAHLTPQRYQRAVLAGEDWFGLSADVGELDDPKNRWLPERRIEEMDRQGVDVQLLSPTDCFYQFRLDPDLTPRIAMALRTLPMQDIDRAIAEMERGIATLGLCGVMIDDHVNNLTYDEAIFDPSGRTRESRRAAAPRCNNRGTHAAAVQAMLPRHAIVELYEPT